MRIPGRMDYDTMLNDMVSKATDAYRRSELLLQMLKDSSNRRYDGTLLSTESRREWEEYKKNFKYAVPKGQLN